jgi:hypothetical protein
MVYKIYIKGVEVGKAIGKEDIDEKFGKFGRISSGNSMFSSI